MTNEQLLQARKEIADALRGLDKAEQVLKLAKTSYESVVEKRVDELRTQLESEHAEEVERFNAAKASASEQKQALAKAREAALDVLEELPLDGDKKPLAGFARRDSVKPYVFNEARLIADLANHAPYLLQIDHKALDSFVKCFAVEGGESGIFLPLSIRKFLPSLDVKREAQWTISEKTIAKEAKD